MTTYNFKEYYDRWNDHGKKLTSKVEITKEILDLVKGHNEVCDLIWAINAANQSNKSPSGLSNTVMGQIRDLSPLLLNHKGKFGEYDSRDKVVKRANRHFRDDPKVGLHPFKERQTNVIEVLKSYISKNSIERNNTRSVEDSFAQGEMPARDEIQAICREIAKPGEEIPENLLKEAVAKKFARQGRKLRADWWDITKKNLVEWWKKR
jgi:hypothetical protein